MASKLERLIELMDWLVDSDTLEGMGDVVELETIRDLAMSLADLADNRLIDLEEPPEDEE